MRDVSLRAVVPGERQVTFEEFSIPDALEPAQVLVRLERTVISAGTETANYTGLDAGVHQPGNWNTYPWRPGYGGVGIVLRRGGAVTSLSEGQRVYGIFHHASHEVVDTARELCVPVPPDLDSTAAVMARMGNVAITAQQRSHARPTDGVAIVGLGTVGNLAGQFFRAAGHRAVGIDLAAGRREVALACGYEAVVDPAGMSTEQLRDALADALGALPKVLVDAVGDSRMVAQLVDLAPRNGEVILLGTPRAPVSGDITLAFNQVHAMGISMVGALEWNIPLLGPDRLSTEGNARDILSLVASGALAVGPLVSHVIRPRELQDAYEGLLTRRDEYLGVVIDWGGLFEQ